MRKLISLGLATAMVASMGVSAFAATIDATDTAKEAEMTSGIAKIGVAKDTTIKIGDKTYSSTATNAQQVAIDLYDALKADDYDVDLYTTATSAAQVFLNQSSDYIVFTSSVGFNPNAALDTQLNVTGSGTATFYDNAREEGPWQNDIRFIFRTSGGEIVPLVEEGDESGTDGVKPGVSLYFQLQEAFSDTSKFKFDVSKGENAKQIKKVSVVEKKWGKSLVTLNGAAPGFVTTGRHAYVKVELNDNMTDKEYKVSFDFKVKVDDKDGAEIGGIVYPKGTASKKFEEVGRTWTYNVTENTDDREFMAGDDGIMVKPVKNEENTVLWTDQNNDLARLTFTADSDVAKYFPKLSTKWPNATYAQLFDDQDAFVFDFVGNPAISSTSRAVLELFCPFLDDEDEYTIDPESVVIYQVADDATLAASTEVELAKAILDGRLIDVTDKFTAGENEDGDFVYTTKTRTLGTYIIAEKAPSEEAFDEAEGEANDEKPADETGKTNPGTGR